MIFTESTIKISNNSAKMDSTIVLYRGDKNVEIRFTILQSPFKYSNTVATNVIESTNASYGQLVIKTPNDKPPIFSEVSATKEGTVLFTITKEMIDEIEEVGVYTFQIRLLDENKQSRVTIPPVENGIEIKEPIAIEDDNTTNVVGLAKANYAVATLSDVDTPAFDDNGQYIKTNWNDGDIITNASLNKIEEGIYTTNENVTATKKYVDDKIKTDLGTSELTTNAKDIKGAVNELNTQYKDIAKKIENVGGFDTSKFMYVTKEVEDVDVPCTGIALNTNTLTFTGSDTQTLTVTKTPSNTTDKVTYATNPTGIVVVNNGVITPIKNGSTVITVTCGSKKATCDVTVTGISTTVAVQSVSLNKNTTIINVGETETLVATISPTNATNHNVTWGTDAPNIATVTNGVIEGKVVGTASISVETVDGSHTDTCNVTVKQGSASTGKNIFDKDTMIDTTKGISGGGEIITNPNWGLATVPVKANTNYSIKRLETVTAGSDNYLYNAVNVGAIGFANSNKTILSYLALDNNNLKNYSVINSSGMIEWIKITTPANCSYLLFNANLRTTADKIQVEEGDTIHNYYTAYEGGNN